MLDVAERNKQTQSVPRQLSPQTVALYSFGYFLASLAIIGAAVFALDRWLIPALENSGHLESYLWTDENHRLNHFTYLKNDARKSDPVWRSAVVPVTPEHPGKKRILVVGDSFVWGDGSSNINTLWWRQLQLELIRRGYKDVEVIAAGLNGASTHDEAGWLASILPKYKPDLVVIGYVTNDPDEKKVDGKPFVRMLHKEINDDDPILARFNSLFPNLTGQLRQLRKLSRQAHLSVQTGALEYADWELAILKGDGFEAYKRTVQTLADVLKASNTPGFVITLPAGFQNKTKENISASDDFFTRVKNYNAMRYAPVKPVFENAGLRFVDTNDAFAKAAASDPLLRTNNSALRLGINPGNGHPGPFSTHFYAVSAADAIEADYSFALPQKTGLHTDQGIQRIQKTQSVEINDCMPPYMNPCAIEPNTFSFTYPPDITEHTLYMPLRKRHVQLALKEALSVKQMQLSGTDLKSAQVFVSYVDDKIGYCSESFAALPLQKGDSLTWNLAGEKRLYAVRLRASFKGGNQNLTLKFTRS